MLVPPELIRADAIDRRREAERGRRRRAALAASQVARTDPDAAPLPSLCAHWYVALVAACDGGVSLVESHRSGAADSGGRSGTVAGRPLSTTPDAGGP